MQSNETATGLFKKGDKGMKKEKEFERVMRMVRASCYMTFPVQRSCFQPSIWKDLNEKIEAEVGPIRHRGKVKKKLPPKKLVAVKKLLKKLRPKCKYYDW